MKKIAVLDQSTIDKIAAGEVIERPSSVVKELVENAIDAGANAVTVEIKEGGTSLIRITDNGEGIPADQVRTAFLRHATSKITKVEDLFGVSSLGFRGEALSSIAAVCQVEVITKTPGQLLGTRYVIEGGQEKAWEEVGAPEGTTFLVRNIFYNTPARRKFLKSAASEAGYISDLVERMALSHPNISFKFINNGQQRIYTSGNDNLRETIYGIYGRDVAANLVEIQSKGEFATLSGFIGKPVISRGNRNLENYFINGRYIRSSVISKAIEDGYKNFMMQHKYPFTVLHISIDGQLLDVNVHPTKMELRFSDNEGLYRFVAGAVRDALSHRDLILKTGFDREKARAEGPAKEIKPSDAAPEPFERKRLSQVREEISYLKRDAAEFGPVREGFVGVLKPPKSAALPKEADGLDGQSAPKRPEGALDGGALAEAQRTRTGETVSGTPQSPAPGGDTAGQGTENPARNNQAGGNTDQSMAGGDRETPARNQTDPGYTGQNPAAAPPAGADAGAGEAAAAAGQTGVACGRPASPAQNPNGAVETGEDAAPEKAGQSPAAETGEAVQGAASQMNLFDSQLLSRENVKEHKIIGQLFDTYWLVEFRDSLYIIDQHAAHEKVLFERTMKKLKTKEHTSQQISPPIILSLSLQEENLLNQYMDSFTSIGFEIEPFGGSDYSIRAVPDNLYGIAQKDLFMEMLDSLGELDGRMATDLINEKVASMSCKAAVKGNHAMSVAEIHALIDELLTLDNPYNCPHGRPTIISMTKYELEKKFKRIV